MKIKFLFLLTLIIGVLNSWGQNAHLNLKSALKLYNLTTYEERVESRRHYDTSSLRIQNASSLWQVLHPTIAFQWKSKKNNFREVELTSLVLAKNSNKTESINDSTNYKHTKIGSNQITTSIAARYEYIVNFNKAKDYKFVPSIGFGLSPFYVKNSYIPLISNSFPSSEARFGLKAFLTPRVNYFISSRLFIDINIPICAFETYFFSEKELNPTVPIHQSSNTGFDYNPFPTYFSGRLGIGVKL